MSIAPDHINDIDGYIYFSPKTTGKVGKAIKIHVSLMVDFLASLDMKTADGQAVIRDIENLRSFANTDIGGIPIPRGGRNDSSPHKAQLERVYETLDAVAKQMGTKRERPFVSKNVRVFYNIHQKAGDAYPTVYINEVQIRAQGAEHAGGFYESIRIGLGRDVKKAENIQLHNRSVYLSGSYPSPKDAMEATKDLKMPANTALFYTPHSAQDCIVAFKDSRLNAATTHAVDELAIQLQRNATSSVNWVVEAEGAQVLHLALKKVSAPLSKHHFKVVNAKGNLPALIDNLTKHNVSLTSDAITIDHNRLASIAGGIITLGRHKEALFSALDKSVSKAPASLLQQYLRAAGEDNQVNLKAMANTTALTKLLAIPAGMRSQQRTFVEALISYQ